MTDQFGNPKPADFGSGIDITYEQPYTYGDPPGSVSGATSSVIPIPRVADGIESIRAAKRSGASFRRFPLKNTGGVAIVKRPSILSLSVNNQVPTHLKGIVHAMVLKGATTDARAAQDEFLKEDPMGNITELIRATAIVGFVNPRLVTDDHAGPLQADQMYVSDIEIEDLAEYFWWCQGQEEEKASAVANFPGNQNQSVSDGPRLSAVRSDAI